MSGRDALRALTQTERRVVGLVAEGLTNPQIARRLFVSPETVKTHLKNVFRKVGVTSRTELALIVKESAQDSVA